MKKPHIIICIIIFVFAVPILLFNAYVYLYPEVFLEKLFVFLEKPIVAFCESAEAERLEMIERGEPVPGRDTMIIWNKKYDICKYYENDEKLGDLCIEEKDFSECIITRIKNFDKRGNKLYIYSYDGYVIIDKENICRVFITVPEEDFLKGYSEDEYGNRVRFYPGKVNHKKIKYLSSFHEFSEKEQKILKGLE